MASIYIKLQENSNSELQLVSRDYKEGTFQTFISNDDYNEIFFGFDNYIYDSSLNRIIKTDTNDKGTNN